MSQANLPINALFLLHKSELTTTHNRFLSFSKHFSGDIVGPAEGLTGEPDHAGSQIRATLSTGIFRHYVLEPSRAPSFLKASVDVVSYLRVVRKLFSSGSRYDVVVAFGFFKTAIAGWLLATMSKSKFVIEVPVVPRKVALCRNARRSWFTVLRVSLSSRLAAHLLRRADHLKLIFPEQLRGIKPSVAQIPHSTFPDYVPVKTIYGSDREDFLLLIGTPLYLKGADLAIKAFHHISPEYSTDHLVIIGSSLGFPYLQSLLSSGDRIQLIDFVPHSVGIDYIQRAKIVLVPSRTDAMPRVAIEGMAAGKAVIASRVDGIPYYLRHNVNCLLFEPGNYMALADNIRLLLKNPGLRREIGFRARQHALAYFDEEQYAERYHTMLSDCISGAPGMAVQV